MHISQLTEIVAIANKKQIKEQLNKLGYEGLQNRQDFCIKFNILFGQNVWSIPNRQSFEMIEELKTIGFYDQFEIEHLEKIQDEDTRMKLNAMLEKYKL